MKTISIIIITYNDLAHTLICLESLKKIDQSGLKINIIVIDNASGKFDANIIKSKFPHINLIKNKKNIGFGSANNIGIKKALKEGSDYILLLNPDTKVDIDPYFLIKMIKLMDKDNKIAIVGPCIKHKNRGITYYDYGGELNLNLAHATHFNKTEHIKNKIFFRDFVSAACMLIKNKTLGRVRPFDEKYFMYLEDVDLCLQIKQNGYKIANLSSSLIYHYGGTSVTDWKKIYYSWLSSLRLTFKWTPRVYKGISILYNCLFYPYLFITWSLKRVKRSLSKSR